MSRPEIDLSPAALDEEFFEDDTKPEDVKPADIMEIEKPFQDAGMEDPDSLAIRDDAINVIGVDELSTQDILKIMENIIPNEPFRIEWVDDQSLNLQFPEDTTAMEAMKKLVGDSEFKPSCREDMLKVRRMIQTERMRESFPNVELSVRFANVADIKERGARGKSRYYLFHGEPDSNEEEQARLSTAYHRYLDRISKNPSTQKKLLKPWHEKKEVDKSYHKTGDLIPDFDPNDPKPKQSRSSHDDLFPEVAADRGRRRRERSISPRRNSAKNFSNRARHESRSRSPPKRSFADIINKRSRRKAADLF